MSKNSNPKIKTFWKIAKIVGNALFYTVVLAVIVAGIMGVVGKIRGKNISVSLFGYSYYIVVTNSMETINPEHAHFLAGHDDRIMVGDLIVTKAIGEKDELQVYDIVTFVRGDKVIVHRIVNIKTDSNGVVLYETRGDSNNASDGWRSRDEFLGIMVRNAGPNAGKAVDFVKSGWGIVAIAGSVGIILIATLIGGGKKSKKLPDQTDDTTEEQAEQTDAESETQPVDVEQATPQSEEKNADTTPSA